MHLKKVGRNVFPPFVITIITEVTVVSLLFSKVPLDTVFTWRVVGPGGEYTNCEENLAYSFPEEGSYNISVTGVHSVGNFTTQRHLIAEGECWGGGGEEGGRRERIEEKGGEIKNLMQVLQSLDDHTGSCPCRLIDS